MSAFRPLVFSGIQASGNLHLGNYLGALQRWTDLQQKYECIFCVVDMHALTVNPNPHDLLRSTREVTAAFLAAGIDPKRHIVFNQSRVHQHAELAWVFNCVARIGWMNRMTQFKDKAGKDRENVSLGLFAYPTLMAADILVYRATMVPVGEDQKQHIELARDIAQKFNVDYSQRIGELGVGTLITVGDVSINGYFPMAEALIGKTATRVMSLRDGTKKMSKSDPSELSRINLIDSAEDISKKFRKAKTDPEPLPETIDELAARPEADNLVGIFAALSGSDKNKVLAEYGGKQFSDFKPALADLAVTKLAPITGELRRLNADPGYIDSVLRDGSERASVLAEETMKHVRDIVGYLQN